jgi:D-alanine transaminase
VLVYLNGEYVPQDEARVSVDDRGFLFADGVYEVIRIYAGQPHELDEHLDRLSRGLAALQIEYRDTGAIERAPAGSCERTRCPAPAPSTSRSHAARRPGSTRSRPAGTRPPCTWRSSRTTPHPATVWEDGVEAITAPDTRWARCDIKSVSLLPNILANQAAKAAATFEAILVRDGVVTEGSHSNVWGVRDNRLITYPASNYILAGMTRARVFRLAERAGDSTAEDDSSYAEELHELDEIFLTGTTTEVMPVVKVDGRTVVDGEPGPVTRKVMRAFRESLPG